MVVLSPVLTVPKRDSERVLLLIPETSKESAARHMLEHPAGDIGDFERSLRIGKPLRKYYVEAGCQEITAAAQRAGVEPPLEILLHWRTIGRSHRLNPPPPDEP